MTGPRFVVTKRDPVYWHVLDRFTDQLDVIAFPLDVGTAAHAIERVTAEILRNRPDVIPFVEHSLAVRLHVAGYTVPRRRPSLP